MSCTALRGLLDRPRTAGGHSFALCMPGARQPPDETAAAVCSWPRLALEFVAGLGLVNRTRGAESGR